MIPQKRQHYRPVSLTDIGAKISAKYSKTTQQYIIRIIHNDQVKFTTGMQGFFCILESTHMMHHINKLKIKNHMIISIDAAKANQQNSACTDDKISPGVNTEGTYLNIIKAIYEKPTANILNGEKQSIYSKIRN